MTKLHRYLPLILLLGLALYLSQQVHAGVPERATQHAPEWDNNTLTQISASGAYNEESRPYLDVAPNGTKLIAVFNRRVGPGNDFDPYFSRSTNSGQTWVEAPIHSSLGPLSNNSLEVNLEIDSNGMGHAVWVEGNNQILYVKESDWDPNSVPVVIDTAEIEVASPQIVATGTVLHLIWRATNFVPGLPQIWYSRSNDGGSTWSTKTLISPDAPQADTPHMVVDNEGNLNVVWEQLSNSGGLKTYIYYTKGTISGQTTTWSDAIRIGDVDDLDTEEDEFSARRPKILVDNGRLHVTFTTFASIQETQWAYYVNCPFDCQDEESWSNNINASGTSVLVNSNSPKYIVSDLFKARGCIYSYFHGIDETIADNEIIIGVNNCDAWSSFGRDDAITNPQAQSLHASVAVTNEWIHMVYDLRDGGPDGSARHIYYIRGVPPPYKVILPFIAR